MSELNIKLDHLNEHLDALFEQLSACTHQQLNSHPKPDSWSAIQVMHHLMLAESYSMMYCEKKLKNTTQFRKSSVATYARSSLLRLYLLSGLKAKAPPRVSTDNLPESDSIYQVMQQWGEQRQKLRVWLEKILPDYLDKAIYKHPIAGHLTIPGMLDFFEAHFRHHIPQISKAARINIVLP